MSDSSDQIDGATGAGSSKLWPAFLVLVPLLYFLSVGPAIVAYENSASVRFQTTLQTIYYPLELFYDNVPFIQPALDLYINLWS
ncbi:MAG: hypothetical protein HON04_18645 [Planctomicrobium sp.]|jgi:hypothetical protein|nr:hypothetical protein [Planctomicrobium sp.]